ncbi:PAS domain S-box-containing protein/diguanylate cyclase (GGDEF)-like protein [Rhizobium sp. PP-CC-3A-592]|nr:PAS domain S-box-containing protein/diguanylate cyclase (GGDEF)-like protein [Rhizobium sp. PP-CC-3A-592]
MTAEWQTLVGNFACVALIISAWMHVGYRLYGLSKLQQQACLGAVLGLGSIASMALSIRFDQGVYLDLRLSMIMTSGVLGGPVSLLVTVLIAGAFRLFLGGAAAGIGILAIAIMAISALALGTVLDRCKATDRLSVIVSALAAAGLSVAVLNLLPNDLFERAMSQLAVPIALANFAATAAAGLAIRYFGSFTLERDILHAALTQAPDFHYVKDLKGRFVVTNRNVAHHHGRSRSSEMIGLSDFDLEPADRAQALFEREQAILQSGEALVDFEECIDRGEATRRWYSTSKVPLRNRQGHLVGLAGVTTDITERKRLAQDLQDSRDLMARAMAQMSDGLAMFDRAGTLLFCNEQYRAIFPRSAYARVPGAHITDIIRAVVRNGERKGLPVDASEEQIQDLAATLQVAKDELIHLCDDRWLSLRTRVAEDGSAMVVASDVTLMKRSEEGLRQMALEMKGLSTTDALTGLANRRAFDEAIAGDLADSRRSGSPLSFLLLDVDRFKAFNDTYGHAAGDDCLKLVGGAIGKAARRKSDTAARYGGEEFCLVLPGVALEEAMRIADDLRHAIRTLAVTHVASEAGIVTASIGVVCMQYPPDTLVSSDIVKMADEALYRAKSLGRDRTEANVTALARAG